MVYQTLISTQELYNNLGKKNWTVIDCTFYLDDTERGRMEFLEAHIPGAVYAHLDDDLSGPVIKGRTGRHPLPQLKTVKETFSGLGIDQNTQVVAYDSRNGAIAAVRLWWMLRWLGHKAAAVLDGGFQKWNSEKRPLSSGKSSTTRKSFVPTPQPSLIADLKEVEIARNNPTIPLIDARANERYLGLNEPIDVIAGHIPGALNLPHEELISDKGTFKSSEHLQQLYRILFNENQSQNSIVYCGSGVTSIMHLLAMEHIGLRGGRLYVGSWSEWITDKNRPVATIDQSS